MGEATDGTLTGKKKGVLDQDRPLKAGDFCSSELESAMESHKISKRTLLREINFFLGIFKRQGWIEEEGNHLFLGDVAIKIISLARRVREDKISDPQDVRIATLGDLVNHLIVTTIPQDEYLNERERNVELSSQVSELKRENNKLREQIERLEGISRIAQNHADQRLKDIEALKHLISAMTYSQTREREALIKEFVGGHIGEIFNPVIWGRNR